LKRVLLISPPVGPTDSLQLIRVRRVQSFFRQSILAAYSHRRAITASSIPAPLNTSHIIPWADDQHRRADPRNGLCLNVLHDRAFDRGLISFTPDLHLLLSPALTHFISDSLYTSSFHPFSNKPLQLPERFHPDPQAIAYHREHRFLKSA
jgi:putative restriction endonuclease